MSRNGLVVAGLALVIAVVAVILPFVLPSGGGSDVSAINALQDRVDALESQSAGSGFRVAYVDVERVFMDIFLPPVQDLRDAAKAKNDEATDLYTQYNSGLISESDFQDQFLELQAELLDATITVDVVSLDRMMASDRFADVVSSLEVTKEQLASVSNAAKDLISNVRTGVMNPTEYQTRYQQVKNAYTELDQTVTNAATYAITQAAQKLAQKAGYDLVLNKRNVVVFPQTGTGVIPDITDSVKLDMSDYL
jgi:Skp family chaperone for outer membrane proteins